MCGRTACTLAPADICKACGHTNKGGKRTQPKWKDPPGGQKYFPSYNMAPTTYTPVLLSTKHFSDKDLNNVYNPDPTQTAEEDCDSDADCDWLIQPMQWGLVPSWHTGDPKSVQFSTINARSDGMLTKRTFKQPLEKGRRCVVLIDGYYEWKTTGTDDKKQPYYIYFPQPESTQKHTQNDRQQSQTQGKKLLTMAGLFDVWHPKDQGEPVYSYSMITVDAHEKLSWLHHRMPAILRNEDEVRAWLDFGSVPLASAVKLIRPIDDIQYHPVAPSVGNVKNKSAECIEKYDPKKPKPTAGSKFMQAWLTKGKSPSKPTSATKPDTDGEPDTKKHKTQ